MEHKIGVPVVSILSLIFAYLMQKYLELVFPAWTAMCQEAFNAVREKAV